MSGPVSRNEFVIVHGDAAGTRIAIPPGKATIGSAEGSRIRLPAPGVSRSHAEVTLSGGRTVLADRASRNGSWVNGRLITSPTELTDGDLVQFGEVRLRFLARNADDGFRPGRQPPEGHASGGQDSGGHPGGSAAGRQRTGQKAAPASARPKEGLGTALLFAAGINLVGLFGNTVTAFLTELTPTWTWFVTPIVGLAVALAVETLGYYRKTGSPEPAVRQDRNNPQNRHGGNGPHERSTSRRPLAVTLLATVILLGGGAWLVTAGVSYAVGYYSGNEAGVQRLESQVATEAQGVTVTILGVQSTPHFTRVEIRVNNGTGSSMALPLFQNATLTAPDGTTFDADPFRSSWQPQIPPGGVRKGTINFESQLPEQATTVSLNFVQVFVMGFDGPQSITVPGIPLKPLATPPS